MEGKICNSCKKKIVNDPGSVTFKCPKCGQYDIVRCKTCRVKAIKYKCPGCNLIGPN
ncbi:MAG TPA: zinc finger domain-containing protein [Candidatus Nanoarchaeia archaeon]|nr:zinc finger domain-containing protein [Candidatus Nanoarchaeia archaeon]